MRILWIGTKPPLPATDGGRLVAIRTLRALADAGLEIDLVAPVFDQTTGAIERELAAVSRPHLVEVRAPRRSRTIRKAMRTPLSIARHSHPPVKERVAALLAEEDFELVHVEQLQAFAQAAPARALEIPVVMRAQNVESDLWRSAARWLPWESGRLADYERLAVRRANAVIALSRWDAARLRSLAGDEGTKVIAVPPPFPARLPAGETRLRGNPALVLMGSAGWHPNRDANRWFVRRCWPSVLARVPRAVLHVFAAEPERPPRGRRVVFHPAPDHSADAFPRGGVLVVPLRVASGVRMKILEAWARGVCVVATATAAAGLSARDGKEVMVANEATEFAEAIHRLAGDSRLQRSLVVGGRRALEEHHHPRAVADRILTVYASVAG